MSSRTRWALTATLLLRAWAAAAEAPPSSVITDGGSAPAVPPVVATASEPPKSGLPTGDFRLPLGGSPNVEVSGGAGKGVTVQVGEVLSLNLRSRVQVRYQLNIPPEQAGMRALQQTVNIGTLRLWFSGFVLTPKLTYMIQLALAGRDYRDGATSPLFDAFLDWRPHRDFAVRAGQYFVPFDRLRTVRELALQLADRPVPVGELTLDRDVGLTVYSDRFLHDASWLAWRAGVFGGGGTNLTRGKPPGLLAVARVELRPLGPIDDDSEGDLDRRARPGLALGGAVAGNWSTNRLRSTTGPTFTGGSTDSFHAAVDLVFKWRGFALQAEYLWKKASIDQLTSTNAMGATVTEWTRSGQGFVVQASYTFDPPIEVVGRFTRLYAIGATDPSFIAEVGSRGSELAFGLNWYLNGHRFKLQADWIARFSPYTLHLGTGEQVVHVQVDVTF